MPKPIGRHTHNVQSACGARVVAAHRFQERASFRHGASFWTLACTALCVLRLSCGEAARRGLRDEGAGGAVRSLRRSSRAEVKVPRAPRRPRLPRPQVGD